MSGCPFCAPDPSRVLFETELVLALWDAFPVAPGHALIVPRRHVASLFDARPDERAALFAALDTVRARIEQEHTPDGYNVGVNIGEAAGQTVPHLHLHVIPRYLGDMDDPRGGVRHVIPSKGNYKRDATIAPLSTGGPTSPFLRHLRPLFERATDIAIVAAFVQQSGLARLRPSFDQALARGARIRLLTGDYLDITQAAALEDLLDWTRATESPGALECRVVEVARLPGATRTFHPKSWRFEGPGLAVCFVGSSNISAAALGEGIEWNLRVERDGDAHAWERAVAELDALWASARVLDEAWVAAYAARAVERERAPATPLPTGEEDREPVDAPPEPHEVQRDALAALARTRADGHRRGLVVLATPLSTTSPTAASTPSARSTCSTRDRRPRGRPRRHAAPDG